MVPVLFNNFINYLDKEIEYSFRQFAASIVLGRSVGLLDSRKALQRDLERLVSWVHESYSVV